MPTPAWTTEVDPVTGNEYLVPPPEVEAQVMEAFEAVLACKVLVVSGTVPDYSNQETTIERIEAFQQAVLDGLDLPGEGIEKLLAFQREVQDRAAQFMANEWVLGEQGCAYGGFQAVIPPDRLEAVPVRCQDTRRCSVGMVKKNYAIGAILYTSPEICTTLGLDDPCAVMMTGDNTPYLLYVAVVERDGDDGPWQVTAFQWEVIQRPE